jgi:hypothetical protein
MCQHLRIIPVFSKFMLALIYKLQYSLIPIMENVGTKVRSNPRQN